MILAVKALVYDQKQGIVRSPSHNAATWGREGYFEAACRQRCARIPGECGCGVYATTSLGILLPYMKLGPCFAALCLPAGETEVWSSGWRSQAAQVSLIVRPDWWLQQLPQASYADYTLAAMAGGEYFDVDVVSAGVALEMIRQSWVEMGYAPAGPTGEALAFEKVHHGAAEVRAA